MILIPATFLCSQLSKITTSPFRRLSARLWPEPEAAPARDIRGTEQAQMVAVQGALAAVTDPQSGHNLKALGLIGEVTLDSGYVWVTLLCASYCPLIATMQRVAIERAIMAVSGIRHVEVTLSCEPEWASAPAFCRG